MYEEFFQPFQHDNVGGSNVVDQGPPAHKLIAKGGLVTVCVSDKAGRACPGQTEVEPAQAQPVVVTWPFRLRVALTFQEKLESWVLM